MAPATTRLLRSGLLLFFASIGFFHLLILWSRLSDGSVLEPLVVARWITSVAILATFSGLRRRGVSVFHWRAALILWLLVILIHGIGLVPGAAALQAMPGEVVLAATPIGVAVASALAAIAVFESIGLKQRIAARWLDDAGPRAARRAGRLAFIGPRAPPG